MTVYTNQQAQNYLDKVTNGEPVRPNVGGFFYSDIEQGWLVFKAGSTLEFWIEQTEKDALNRLTK